MVISKQKDRKFNGKRGVAFILLAFFGLKAFVYTELGQATYDRRMEQLAQGVVIEQFASKLMHADPVTLWVAAQFEKMSEPMDFNLDGPSLWSRIFSVGERGTIDKS